MTFGRCKRVFCGIKFAVSAWLLSSLGRSHRKTPCNRRRVPPPYVERRASPEIEAAAMDEYTTDLWSLDELRAGHRGQGYSFFDCSGWFSVREPAVAATGATCSTSGIHSSPSDRGC
jgi:hypothetical protein